jgi:hypothetical protein
MISASDSSRSIRTAEWCLRQDVPFGGNVTESSAEHTSGELFVRPDDRWEANDVAKLCPDAVESLTKAMDGAWQHWLRHEPVPSRLLADLAAEPA